MAVLWRILTIAAFAAHILMGCCAHHGHACEATAQAVSECEDSASHEACPEGHGSDSGHHHHGPRDCQGGQCSFVLPSHGAGLSLSQLSPAFVVPLVVADVSVVDAAAEQRLFIANRLLLPVRLHLVNQVLLI